MGDPGECYVILDPGVVEEISELPFIVSLFEERASDPIRA